MNSKDKELLLKDLCARLPYGVKVQVYDNRYAPTTLTQIDVKKKECVFNFNVPVENCLPYLRSMSNMTEEEENEYRAINCYEGLFPCNEDALDYVLSHHFDYRGLIPMGLALEAPEDMYQNVTENGGIER